MDLELVVVIEPAEEFRCGLFVDVACCPRVYVERNSESLHRVFDDCVVAVDDVLWGHTLVAGFDCDRHTMFVASTDHDDILAFHSEEPGIDVGGNIYAGKVADVDRPVCIGQGGCDKGAFELLFHIIMLSFTTFLELRTE